MIIQGDKQLAAKQADTGELVVARKVALSFANYDQVLSLASGDNMIITITPPEGELWHIKVLNFSLIAPAGATTGYYSIVFSPGLDVASDVLLVQSDYNRNIIFRQNCNHTSSAIRPTTEIAQQMAVLNMEIAHNIPLRIFVYNVTDVAHTQTFYLRITKEVEYIES
jgi:hypothetical protein